MSGQQVRIPFQLQPEALTIIPIMNDAEADLRQIEADRGEQRDESDAQAKKLAHFALRNKSQDWSYLGSNNPQADGFYDF